MTFRKARWWGKPEYKQALCQVLYAFHPVLTSKGGPAIIPNLQMRELRRLKGKCLPKVSLSRAVPSTTGWRDGCPPPNQKQNHREL